MLVVYLYNKIKQIEIMTITNTITGKSFETKYTNIKFIKDYIIADEIKFLNEEESEKAKEERHYYTESNFEITE